MEIKFAPRRIRVSKNYLWHESDREFEHRCTKTRQSDSLYSAKVDVYEDRVRTWFLDWAANLVQADLIDDGTSAGDYVALSVALAYIEGVEQYRRGGEPDLKRKGEAGKWFRATYRQISSRANVRTLSPPFI
jgi:hypothetical protein